jgi:hypothetical protein
MHLGSNRVNVAKQHVVSVATGDGSRFMMHCNIYFPVRRWVDGFRLSYRLCQKPASVLCCQRTKPGHTAGHVEVAPRHAIPPTRTTPVRMRTYPRCVLSTATILLKPLCCGQAPTLRARRAGDRGSEVRLTLPWREMDSNFRSLGTNDAS